MKKIALEVLLTILAANILFLASAGAIGLWLGIIVRTFRGVAG